MIVITEKMVFRGKRRVTPHSARLKAQSWSTAWQEELGIGFRIAIINSDGENWMDAQSAIELREFFHQKGLNFAKAYMAKFDQLRSQLLDQVHKDVHGDYDEQFIKLLAYCFITRWVIEPLFESLADADQKMIEAWRNDEQLFLPMDLWYRANDQEAPDHEWSVVVRNGTVQMYSQKLSFFEKEPTESNLLKGSPAYGGNVTGMVRVILSPLEFNQMQPGEILVASMTTPDYSPVLKKAAAIVTDEGGVTSHAAIYARELKIPCVIGTGRATKVLKTGDMVEVDATSGIVKIIK
ncbi:MAG: hypothetical protein KBB55_01730 [Candidatus Buchananbacteria bacterium]|nr:hypothetical protein [Candidatus Buchananbacteria bacterium]